VLLTMRAYRRNHFPHHRHLMTDRDPDWVRKQTPEWRFPQTRTQLARMLVAYATGVGFLRFVVVAMRLPKQPKSGVTREEQTFARARVVYLIVVAASVTALHGWEAVLLYWFVPYLTWMQLCFHIRSIAEHFAIRGRSGVFAQTRTVLATALDRVFLVPKNVGYHLEHHLYPSVPFYRLPELHRTLMSQPAYRDSAHVTRGYLRVLGECTTSEAASGAPG
jgi:fatty acid desaturase